MKKHKGSGGVNRRQLLSMGAVGGIAAGLGGSIAQPVAAQSAAMPKTEVAKLADLTPGTEIHFAYPDDDSPAVLLVLPEPVEEGIGPDQNVVAFSTLCTHKGCQVSYYDDQNMLVCPCHWSSFDPAKKGRLVIGQASSGLPQITLTIEGGAIHATGVTGLIYGRQTNVI